MNDNRVKTKIFFVHPYSLWEKGCIKYHNKLIRQDIPKGTDFDTIPDHILKEMIIKINNNDSVILPKLLKIKLIHKFVRYK